MRELTTLPNGVRVVTQHLKDRDSASIGIWVATGGRFENDINKGAAHFIEHMAFKGSTKYSCDQVKQLVEGVGGNLNAFTGEEETCYYAKVPAKYLPITFDVLSDITVFPKMNARDLNKERTVILEEIKMYLDLPQYHVSELLQELLWPNHPLGSNLAGTPQTVSQMTRQQLLQFHQEHYNPAHLVVSACGNVNHQDIVKWTKKKLGGLKPVSRAKYVTARRDQDKPGICLSIKKTEQMHLALGYLGFENNHPDYYALGMLSIILGGNMSSRLFTEVREKRGLAYSVSSGMKSLDDTGCFMVRAGVDNDKIVPALTLILKVLKGMTQNKVGADEFKRANNGDIKAFWL